jgi:ferredoxin-NADP reductase
VSVAPGVAWQAAEIVAIERATPRIASVFLKAAIAPHVAGQHLDIRLTADDGYEAQRAYSIASAPSDARIELLIEKLEEGEVSSYFHEIARVGDLVDVRGPLGGHFVWRAEDGGPLLLLAGGSGIAPLMAMVREWVRSASGLPLMLAYSARTWDELAFRDELMDIAQRRPAFRFVAVTTREAKRRASDLDRRIDAAALEALLASWGQRPRHAYVCGSNRFVEGVTRGLPDSVLPAGIIRTERYGGAD